MKYSSETSESTSKCLPHDDDGDDCERQGVDSSSNVGLAKGSAPKDSETMVSTATTDDASAIAGASSSTVVRDRRGCCADIASATTAFYFLFLLLVVLLVFDLRGGIFFQAVFFCSLNIVGPVAVIILHRRYRSSTRAGGCPPVIAVAVHILLWTIVSCAFVYGGLSAAALARDQYSADDVSVLVGGLVISAVGLVSAVFHLWWFSFVEVASSTNTTTTQGNRGGKAPKDLESADAENEDNCGEPID